MSKRKPASASKNARSKHARSPKIAAKAQRATQAVIKGPKDSFLRIVAESPPQRDSKHQAPLAEMPTTMADKIPTTMADNDLQKGFDFASTAANVRAYQAKLMEIAQANVQFAFDFTQRIATTRSPIEFLSVIAEFAAKRIAVFQKYSSELAELRVIEISTPDVLAPSAS
jgi:hypothetical protein